MNFWLFSLLVDIMNINYTFNFYFNIYFNILEYFMVIFFIQCLIILLKTKYILELNE